MEGSARRDFEPGFSRTNFRGDPGNDDSEAENNMADQSDIHLLDTMEKVSSYPRNLVVTVVCYISAVNPQTCLAAS